MMKYYGVAFANFDHKKQRRLWIIEGFKLKRTSITRHSEDVKTFKRMERRTSKLKLKMELYDGSKEN